MRDKWPKLGAFIDKSEADVLAYMNFPAQHRVKIHSTNPIERLNEEVTRRAKVVGIFPNEGAIIRLMGAVLLEANDEWQLQNRYMHMQAMAELSLPTIDAVLITIDTMTDGQLNYTANSTTLTDVIQSCVVDKPGSPQNKHPLAFALRFCGTSLLRLLSPGRHTDRKDRRYPDSPCGINRVPKSAARVQV